jgi:hypothetical protein
MEAICSSEKSVDFQQTARHYIPPLREPQILHFPFCHVHQQPQMVVVVNRNRRLQQWTLLGLESCKRGVINLGAILGFRGGGDWDPTDWQIQTVGILIFLQTTILQDITLYWMSHIKLKIKINISLFYLWKYFTIKIIQVNVYVLI